MWVQLVQPRYIEYNGVQRKYNAGDWVDVGKQSALMWIAEGAAEIPEAIDFKTYYGSSAGIVTDDKERLSKVLTSYSESNILEELQPTVAWERNCWIHSSLQFRPELIAIGLGMLDTWQIAVPLMDYGILAMSIDVSEAEKAKTKDIIRDLRVMCYDTRLMFYRNEPDVVRLLEMWRKEGATPLAFLRALYTVKPFILALPVTWTGRRPVANE